MLQHQKARYLQDAEDQSTAPVTCENTDGRIGKCP